MAITHIMADGKTKTDITGHVVKVGEAIDFYRILEKIKKEATDEQIRTRTESSGINR